MYLIEAMIITNVYSTDLIIEAIDVIYNNYWFIGKKN